MSAHKFLYLSLDLSALWCMKECKKENKKMGNQGAGKNQGAILGVP